MVGVWRIKGKDEGYGDEGKTSVGHHTKGEEEWESLRYISFIKG